MIAGQLVKYAIGSKQPWPELEQALTKINDEKALAHYHAAFK